ncbi:PD-(D/E)XK nuclease family transposase [Phascolarctobacterium succinatutens]|uniref:PD-(D/E)XK nuclease family transposase n=1 Tax=Phascolarctobacterium succinatutens TaxID=626940 RepID=UPI0023F87A14|nr:PD-(D/E)XK nuclease family transposase [Phascolarctobacterium succinatutens]
MTKKLSKSSLLLTQEELQKHILVMTLFNDLLARAVLEDKEACEHILRVLTGIKTLVIKKNKTQYVISKLSSHNIIMDVLAEDANNKLYEIEIQKADGGIAHEKRMLYYASTIINEYFFKGDQTYASVPELHIFYISQTDIWKLGKTCYPILKFLGDTNTPYNDGLHMCYINAEVDDNSSIASLCNILLPPTQVILARESFHNVSIILKPQRRDSQLWIISASKFMRLALMTEELKARLKAKLKASKILCLQ